MATRKTIKVQDVKEHCNHLLQLSDTAANMAGYGIDLHPGAEARGFRAGVAAALEYVLLHTDNYHGFRELDPDDDMPSRNATMRRSYY